MLTDDQRIARRLGIGGSDVVAIAGLSEYSTPLDVYLEKIGEAEERPETEAQRWGHIMEPVILREYELKAGVELMTDKRLLSHVSHSYNFMRASLDSCIYIPPANTLIIVDAKNIDASQRSKWGEPGTSKMPRYVHLQMAHYRIVTDALSVEVAVLFGKCDFQVYRYTANPRLEQKIIALEKNFWENHVIPRIPPEPINNEDAKKRWADVLSGSERVASNKAVLAWNDLKEVRSILKQSEAQKERLEVILKNELQDSESLVDECGNILCTWKSQRSGKLKQTELKKAYPVIHAEFVDDSQSRVFRVNER